MQLSFTKMHGLGNDFVVIDAINQSVNLSGDQFRLLADRRFGVGCDQILLVESPQTADANFRYRIFNADGGEVEQCGNGARCFARFVLDQGLTEKHTILVETRAGLITLEAQDDGQITVNMGPARLQPDLIPFTAEAEASHYTITLDGQDYEVGAVSMGNPHAVLRVDDIDTAPLAEIGPQLEHHERFPNRVNVGFMQVVNRNEINLRVWERGVGETLACGTGACAAVVSGIVQGWLEASVRVNLRGGALHIEWTGGQEPVMMTGPAESVFEGKIEL